MKLPKERTFNWAQSVTKWKIQTRYCINLMKRTHSFHYYAPVIHIICLYYFAHVTWLVLLSIPRYTNYIGPTVSILRSSSSDLFRVLWRSLPQVCYIIFTIESCTEHKQNILHVLRQYGVYISIIASLPGLQHGLLVLCILALAVWLTDGRATPTAGRRSERP